MDQLYPFFAEVVRQGSIRRAAERLNISASSVSRQIARLEHDLGAPLLDRHSSGVKLTPAGEILARFVHERSREFARLRAAIDELKRLERGHATLFTVEGMLGGFLPAAMGAFARDYPGLTYEIVVAGSDDVMRAVAADQCDIGIAFEPKPHRGVEVIGLMREPVLAVLSPGFPLDRREPLFLADLAGVPVGLPDRSFGIRQIIDAASEAAGVTLNVRLETNSIDMVRQFASMGMGVAFLPRFAFEREAASGALLGIRLGDPRCASATAQLCVHAERELTWAARRLLDALLTAKDGAFRPAERSASCNTVRRD